MGSLEFEHGSGNLSLNGNFVLEYQVRGDSYFLGSKDPQEFRLDMRELYTTYSGNNFEFRIGKQIHSWGSVDENSPIDVVNAFDYYYLFFQGADRKLGSYSAAVDIYLNDWKLGAVFSPFHHTNRVPVNDPEFPIRLPIVPQEYQIYPIEKVPIEYGAFLEYSHNDGDIRFSGFNGYDRIFNLSGVNVFLKTHH